MSTTLSNATVSPFGDYVAYVHSHKHVMLREIHRNNATYPTGTEILGQDIKTTSLKWSSDASQILVVYDRAVHVMSSQDRSDRVIIRNGSGGLGKIASADFIGNNHVLVTWEFGKTKLWHLNSGKSVDLPDIKTTCTNTGRSWQLRPGNSTPPLFALLAKIGADDHLVLQFPSLNQQSAPIKLQTVDAQSLSWSPDGRWLAVLDTPTASQSLHIYTPDGYLFRSYPSAKEVDHSLGIKSILWSSDGSNLALAKYDGRIELLNTRTFSPLAVIEHNTAIDQSSLSAEDQASIWQETVSATGMRSYAVQPQPVHLPQSKAKAGTEPKDLGIAELCSSGDGSFLATRDCRMLNTIWLWNMATLAAHAVIIQHSDVRSLSWHPSRPATLLIDCAEGIARVFDVYSSDPPIPLPINTKLPSKSLLSWIPTPPDTKLAILTRATNDFDILYPEGSDDNADTIPRAAQTNFDESFVEEASEDSLLDVLSGRKPLPPKTAQTYTEMVDLEVDMEDTVGGGLEDTFRDKRKPAQTEADFDPLDDSEIF